MIAKVTEILNRFCDQNGGGPREVTVVRGRYVGYYLTVVWDGFASMHSTIRRETVFWYIARELGSTPVGQVVSSLHLVTFNEKIEEEAVAAAMPSEMEFLR